MRHNLLHPLFCRHGQDLKDNVGWGIFFVKRQKNRQFGFEPQLLKKFKKMDRTEQSKRPETTKTFFSFPYIVLSRLLVDKYCGDYFL